MRFYENGKRVYLNDMHKSQRAISFDQVNQNSNRLCKGKCRQFRATKPVNGNRYASGQYRCQVCSIFLTGQGVTSNYHCKCCNYRVRSRPRDSTYKEMYHEKVRNINEPWIKQESNEEITEEIIDGKKSTPIYEESDDSVKTYYEFKEFLDSKMSLQANYQLVMLKGLLESGKLHKGEIAEAIAYFNNRDSSDINAVKNYFSVPVYDVLLDHGLVTVDHDLDHIPYYSLNVKLTDFQKIHLSEYLGNRLAKYNSEHNIPDNVYPNANNTGSIDWHWSINKKLLIDHDHSRTQDQTNENIQQVEEKEIIPAFDKSVVKECPRCHTKITGISNSRNFNNLIEEKFGYRQVDPNDPKNRTPQSYCRKCRSQNLVEENHKIDAHSSAKFTNSKYMKIFDSHNDSISIKYCKVESTEIIQKGQNLTNDEIIKKFGVGNMGGIRYSSKNNIIVLCDTQSGHYDDKFDKDFQIIYYTGEGQKGNQTLTAGNQRIINSETTPMFYFIEVPQKPGQKRRGALDNIYKFVGRVKYTKHAFKTESDIDGVSRQVIKFLLEIKE